MKHLNKLPNLAKIPILLNMDNLNNEIYFRQ